MKALGIVRKVDQLGRVVLPIEIRRELDIEPGHPLEFFLKDNNIVLRPYLPGCVFCNSIATHEFKGYKMCLDCLVEIKQESLMDEAQRKGRNIDWL